MGIEKPHFVMGAAVSALAIASVSLAQEGPARPVHHEDGSVSVPAFDLPPSEYMSDEAVAMLQFRARMTGPLPTQELDAEASRAGLAAMLAPQVERMRAAYPVDIAEDEVAGVPVRVVTPKDKEVDPDRVLINLHGGAFQTCWESCSVLEAAPVAVAGGYKVVSVNYRMAPEHKHPAGVEDVEKVYRALLDDYAPEHIGVYGCSAGGALTGQTAAWLPRHDLPQPGAIGIFGAGAARFEVGDSAHVAAYIDGSFPAPTKPGEPKRDLTRGYFDGVDLKGPIVAAAHHPEVIGQFPPTMIITGTRAMDMSPAIYTNSQLIKAGVPSTLIVGEGMGHCYIYQSGVPEARDAIDAIAAFFKANLR